MNAPEDVVEVTRIWLDDIVIEHNFCPFAKFVRDAQRVRIVEEIGDPEAILSAVKRECRLLDSDSEVATTLIVLTHGCVKDFFDYLDMLDIANALLTSMDYEGIYQLASFHPDYVFASEHATSATHYTNRSPYPTFHLIRESDIEKALQHYPDDAETIYRQNQDKARALGVSYFEQKLKAMRCPVTKPNS